MARTTHICVCADCYTLPSASNPKRPWQAPQPLRERIFDGAIIDATTGCWEWRERNQKGYGRMKIMNGPILGAHRVSYAVFVGHIPDRHDIDHKCRNRACVNPDHLEAVPHQVNCQRGDVGAHYGNKTHCPSGHPYEGDNLYVAPSGARHCRTCGRDRMQRARQAAQLRIGREGNG